MTHLSHTDSLKQSDLTQSLAHPAFHLFRRGNLRLGAEAMGSQRTIKVPDYSRIKRNQLFCAICLSGEFRGNLTSLRSIHFKNGFERRKCFVSPMVPECKSIKGKHNPQGHLFDAAGVAPLLQPYFSFALWLCQMKWCNLEHNDQELCTLHPSPFVLFILDAIWLCIKTAQFALLPAVNINPAEMRLFSHPE